MHLIKLLCADLYPFPKASRKVVSEISAGVSVIQLYGAQMHYIDT